MESIAVVETAQQDLEPVQDHSEMAAVMDCVPAFPGVAVQTLDMIEQDNFSGEQIEELLRLDPGLSAEILKLANSAFYGYRAEIDSISRATVVLGSEALKRLALSVSLAGYVREFRANAELQACWQHCVACALISEELAGMLSQPKSRAYTAGLLHDVGRLALLAGYPNRWRDMLAVCKRLEIDELEAERQLFGIDHCSAGEQLARQWNLPDELVSAITGHHSAEINDAGLLSIVAAGDILADVLGYDVLEVEHSETIEDCIKGLPLTDHGAAVASIEQLTRKIDETLATMA